MQSAHLDLTLYAELLQERVKKLEASLEVLSEENDRLRKRLADTKAKKAEKKEEEPKKKPEEKPLPKPRRAAAVSGVLLNSSEDSEELAL